MAGRPSALHPKFDRNINSPLQAFIRLPQPCLSVFPPIPLQDPSSLGSTFEAEVRKHHGDNPGFKYKDANGAPIGPFAVLR